MPRLTHAGPTKHNKLRRKPIVERLIARAADEGHSHAAAVSAYHAHDIPAAGRKLELVPPPASQQDYLTGFANRAALWDWLAKLIAPAGGMAGRLQIALIGLDRFKPVNDRHGHRMGDRILSEIARRIVVTTGGDDLRARFGGDQFVVVSTRQRSCDEMAEYCAQLIAAIGRPIEIDGQSVAVGASIGFAGFPDHAASDESLMRCAELALTAAKQAGRGTVRAYLAEMQTASVPGLAAEEEIRAAITDHAIIPYFQPIVDVATRRIRGFEALARWQHPTRGLIAPGDFIPVALAAGELGNLSLSMLHQSCIAARNLPIDLTIAINIAPQQIQDDWLASKILRVLTETGFPPHRLEIELTESALVTDFAAARRVMHSLQNLGISIALDDFGTGYSSLQYLSELQFDKIKIDRSFVHTLHDRTESAKIINAIVGLGLSLGVPTMAEGVETERDAAALGAIGCRTAQGYLYSRPVPADQLIPLVQGQIASLSTATAA